MDGRLVASGVIAKIQVEYKQTVVRLLTEMRRAREVPFAWTADNTRWRREPTTHSSLESARHRTAEADRRAVWDNLHEAADSIGGGGKPAKLDCSGGDDPTDLDIARAKVRGRGRRGEAIPPKALPALVEGRTARHVDGRAWEEQRAVEARGDDAPSQRRGSRLRPGRRRRRR